MAVKFSPIFNSQVVDSTGAPASGWKVYTYVAGSSTPLATYTTSAGNVSQTNPIEINALGFPTTGQIWLTAGQSYKLVLTNASDVVQKTEDNVAGVNDTSVSIDQWQDSGLTPTYVSATQFTLAGDQTSAFQVGRRVKCTVTAGTVYGRISVSAYAALTTVTVVNDSGTLDSGLSAVSLGLLTPTNPSLPVPVDTYPIVSGSSDQTKLLRFEVDGFTTSTTRVVTVADRDITIGKAPTRQVLTSGSAATYTTPAGCTRINVRMVGGGGGGGAQITNAGTGGNNTTFGTLTANGGGAGSAGPGGNAGTGGSASGGDINIPGGGAMSGVLNGTGLGFSVGGGIGGASAFGGAGQGGGVNSAGGNAAANSGSGGGGAGGNAAGGGGGGGSGGYVEKLIVSPSATYTYTVGASATGGTAGGAAGGTGAAGIIIVDEYYN